jgi:hypothetical protein
LLALRDRQRQLFVIRFRQSLVVSALWAGAALTLGEFALWLNRKDVYFVREGRSSIDAMILFGSLLAISTLRRPFRRELDHGATGVRNR